jgi:hypothetical protein
MVKQADNTIAMWIKLAGVGLPSSSSLKILHVRINVKKKQRRLLHSVQICAFLLVLINSGQSLRSIDLQISAPHVLASPCVSGM